MSDEHWKPVVGMEQFYEVSDQGRLRSKHKRGRPTKDGLLSLQSNAKGYRRIHLSDGTKRFSIVVHRLVLEAFIGPRPSGFHQSNHKNGIKQDNRAENLEWLTPIQNNAHAVAMGLWTPKRGEQHGRAILTEADVREIRAVGNCADLREQGRKYGVHPMTIKAVLTRRNWRHVG